MPTVAASTPPAGREGRRRLILVFGGQSSEHDVSCSSAFEVLHALDPDRYDVEAVGITRDGTWVRAQPAPVAGGHPRRLAATGKPLDPFELLGDRAGRTTVVLPLLHGTRGEDGTVQGLLELAGVAYVGSGVLGSAVCMDKLTAKDVAKAHGLPQVAHLGLRATGAPHAPGAVEAAGLTYPLFVKPANQGSSVGVTRVADPAELSAAVELAGRYDDWVVVEQAVAGREIEVAVLGNESPRASVPGEIVTSREFYDYEDKYLGGGSRTVVPAELPDGAADELARLAVAAFEAMRCEGMARVDFFYETGGRGPLLNEVNTIPGFTPISMYPKLWAASGLGYPDLVDELVRLALERHARRRQLSITR